MSARFLSGLRFRRGIRFRIAQSRDALDLEQVLYHRSGGFSGWSLSETQRPLAKAGRRSSARNMFPVVHVIDAFLEISVRRIGLRLKPSLVQSDARSIGLQGR